MHTTFRYKKKFVQTWRKIYEAIHFSGQLFYLTFILLLEKKKLKFQNVFIFLQKWCETTYAYLQKN